MVDISALTKLSKALNEIRFTFTQPEFTQADSERSRIVHKLDNHVLPRLRNIEAPLICVVAGSTGAGKSTLVNSLLETEVATASPVRPTTRRPLLIHAAADQDWFAVGSPLLPQLAKVQVALDAPPTAAEVGSHQELEVRSSTVLPAGLALLDAPDFDSLVAENRELSRKLLDVADMWVFVTTATRYADAVPWEILREAKKRNLTLAVVLNRTPEESSALVSEDLSQLLTEAGLEKLPLWVLPETKLENGRIPFQLVEPLSNWLRDYTESSQLRIATAMRALLGTVRVLANDTHAVRRTISFQNELLEDSQQTVNQQLEQAITRVKEASADGSLLKGEVLARWQELVGVSELTKAIEKGFTLFKYRVRNFFGSQKPQLEAIEVALESGLATIISTELFTAYRRVRADWKTNPYLQDLETEIAELATEDIQTKAQNLTLVWQQKLLEMISLEGGSRRTTAKIMAAGVNLLGVALMIVVFASTGGLTGAEVGVAGVTSIFAQKLLEVIFGEQAVKTMTKRAHTQLVELVKEFYSEEFAKLRGQLPPLTDTKELTEAIFSTERTVRELEHEIRTRLGEKL
ncbi:dynamin family protein [Gleimia sp. 6138-11-ORH1]|uniref:dynamin family protein n=1 Tax=Gleimia sp. 6138-11-ORH1 TaxID=2973937 RepID=UPI002167B667|nr:dynamin family protein [Gleimia sp. 6138-11-ORH1]MCS4484402.1 dynamin family protein [Gleimia sp. 6138-11-ORH1]